MSKVVSVLSVYAHCSACNDKVAICDGRLCCGYERFKNYSHLHLVI